MTNEPTWSKPCDECGTYVQRWRGETHVDCRVCGTTYNAAGQRLRANWSENMSNYDEDVSDMEGMENRLAEYERQSLDDAYFEPEYRDG